MRRVALVGLLGAVVAFSFSPSVAARPDPDPDPVRAAGDTTAVARLAERYAPVVFLREQDHDCDTAGEAFEPAPVEVVLDNREVALRQVGNGDPVAVWGPSAADLFDLQEGWYLDFPGDALDPGCIFERDHRRFAAGRPSVIYARATSEEGRPGLLALQYWFFWYHNPAKNDHEGDWEFVQLLFEADTADQALQREPVAVGYAQHVGGERSDWQAEKLDTIDGRPVVYPAVGSHASYYGQALYLGRSGSEGFGCDNTEGPSRRIDPDVVLLPDDVTGPSDPFAWLTFHGRWGQRESGFFNGPTGPAAKDRFTRPVTWHEGLRDSSIVIPGGGVDGNPVLTSFCAVVGVGSDLLVKAVRSPGATLVLLGIVVFSGVAVARRTRWSPADTSDVRRRRAMGQILRTALRVLVRKPLTIVAIGLVYVPVAMVTSAVQALVQQIPFVDALLALAGDRSWAGVALALTLGGLGNLLAFVIVSAATAIGLDRAGADVAPATIAAIKPLLLTLVRAIVVVGGLFLTIVGLPWAIRQLVRYQVAPQVVALEGLAGRAALARSSELVKGHWWWTAVIVTVVQTVIGVAGVAFALVVLVVFTSLPLWAFNLLTSIIYVLLVPIGAAAMTYVYGSLVSDR